MSTRSIEEVPDVELATEFVKYFGVRRAVTLMGWCVLWGMQGHADDLASYRRRLKAENSPEWRTVFRALADLREFREHLEGGGVHVAGLEGLACRVGRIGPHLKHAA